MGRVDLHLHSSASDGSDAPGTLAERLGEVLLAVLTDHDTRAGQEEFRSHLHAALPVPEGVELSMRWSGGTFHLLVYGRELDGLDPLLEAQRRAREERNREILAAARSLGFEIAESELLAAAGATSLGAKSVGRPHFARVLVDKGAAANIQDAFDRYLAKGRPLYRPKATLELAEVGELAADLGLVAVVAHPLSLGAEPLADTLRSLRRQGLTGMECYYAAYEPPVRAELATLAADLGMVATGGSDYHGTFKPGLEPLAGRGDLEVPDVVAHRLLERLELA